MARLPVLGLSRGDVVIALMGPLHLGQAKESLWAIIVKVDAGLGSLFQAYEPRKHSGPVRTTKAHGILGPCIILLTFFLKYFGKRKI